MGRVRERENETHGDQAQSSCSHFEWSGPARICNLASSVEIHQIMETCDSACAAFLCGDRDGRLASAERRAQMVAPRCSDCGYQMAWADLARCCEFVVPTCGIQATGKRNIWSLYCPYADACGGSDTKRVGRKGLSKCAKQAPRQKNSAKDTEHNTKQWFQVLVRIDCVEAPHHCCSGTRIGAHATHLTESKLKSS